MAFWKHIVNAIKDIPEETIYFKTEALLLGLFEQPIKNGIPTLVITAGIIAKIK